MYKVRLELKKIFYRITKNGGFYLIFYQNRNMKCLLYL